MESATPQRPPCAICKKPILGECCAAGWVDVYGVTRAVSGPYCLACFTAEVQPHMLKVFRSVATN